MAGVGETIASRASPTATAFDGHSLMRWNRMTCYSTQLSYPLAASFIKDIRSFEWFAGADRLTTAGSVYRGSEQHGTQGERGREEQEKREQKQEEDLQQRLLRRGTREFNDRGKCIMHAPLSSGQSCESSRDSKPKASQAS